MKLFKEEKGLTLIEILVSLTLLAVIITSFSGALINGMFFEREVEKRLLASNLASGILETIEFYSNEKNVEIVTELEKNAEYSYPFSGLKSDNDLFDELNRNLDKLILEKSRDIDGFEKANIFNRGQVETEAGKDIKNLYEVEINISWDDNNYQLTNLLYDDDDDNDDDEDDNDEDDEEDDEEDEDEEEDDNGGGEDEEEDDEEGKDCWWFPFFPWWC